MKSHRAKYPTRHAVFGYSQTQAVEDTVDCVPHYPLALSELAWEFFRAHYFAAAFLFYFIAVPQRLYVLVLRVGWSSFF